MKKIFVIIVIFSVLICVLGFVIYISTKNKKIYTAQDFGIEIVKSKTDYDNDGIDDYTDILQGAKIEAKNKPKYKSTYYVGGYPPDEEGVCTDVIWRALKNAGYSLKDMIDEDIKNNTDKYPRVNGKPDPNIDFRRVPNLQVYLKNNHLNLTTDLSEIAQWQPGDIVVFGSTHIGIISDKRNEKGIPYIIHNAAQPFREEDALEQLNEAYKSITGHYRLREN